MAQFWQRAPVHERASCASNGASQKKCSASAAAKQIAFDPKSFPISSKDITNTTTTINRGRNGDYTHTANAKGNERAHQKP